MIKTAMNCFYFPKDMNLKHYGYGLLPLIRRIEVSIFMSMNKLAIFIVIKKERKLVP